MKTQIASILSAALVVAAPATMAEEATGPWSGSASLGYLATSGNSDTTNVSASTTVGYNVGRWHHEGVAGAIGATTDDETTAEAYRLGYTAKYDFTDTDYIFGRLNWDKDKFSGYDQQTSATLGYGRRVLNTDDMVLNLELGAGYKQNDLRDGTSEDEAILRAAGDFTWTLTETSSFEQKLSVERGSSNTYMESASTLKARLIGATSLALGYTVKRNSDVPEGSSKTDTFTTIGVEYTF